MRYVYVDYTGKIQVSTSKYSTEQKFLLGTEHILHKNRLFQATSDDRVAETIRKIKDDLHSNGTVPVC